MGFDNECIVNIQTLPGEYFCPVCRTLVYPNEALQAACTHLFCKPCLAYVVATTAACPYDGYLVTEADAKPLVESNKQTAEAIGKIEVHCLYHRSGCQWKGTLSDCVTHCKTCTFGNSPVVCNRCGAQITHRQVQEHAQTCPGVQPQAHDAQSQSASVQGLSAAQPLSSQLGASASGAPSTATVANAVSSAPGPTKDSSAVQGGGQPTATPQTQAPAQALTQEQWQQQYQQYYQQHPGYDAYQQQHQQQYGYYQQQAPQQYVQPHGQQHPQTHIQQPSQVISQPPQQQGQPPYTQLPGQVYSAHAHVQPQALPNAQVQTQPLSQAQGQVQGQTVRPPTHHPQILQTPQTHLYGQPFVQQQGQVPQPHAQPIQLQNQAWPQQPQHMAGQNHPPQLQHQPPHAQHPSHPNSHFQMQSQPPAQNLQPPGQPQAYARPHSTVQPPLHVQQQAQQQPLSQPQAHALISPTNNVTGYQSFPQPHLQSQMPGASMQQRGGQTYPQQYGTPQQQNQRQYPMPNRFEGQHPPQTQIRPSVSQFPGHGPQQPLIQGSHHPTHGQQFHQSHLPMQQVQHQVQHSKIGQAMQHPGISVQKPETYSQNNQIQQQPEFSSGQPSTRAQQNIPHDQISSPHVPLPHSQTASQPSHQPAKPLPDGASGTPNVADTETNSNEIKGNRSDGRIDSDTTGRVGIDMDAKSTQNDGAKDSVKGEAGAVPKISANKIKPEHDGGDVVKGENMSKSDDSRGQMVSEEVEIPDMSGSILPKKSIPSQTVADALPGQLPSQDSTSSGGSPKWQALPRDQSGLKDMAPPTKKSMTSKPDLGTQMGNNMHSGLLPGPHGSFGQGPPSLVSPISSHFQGHEPIPTSHSVPGILRPPHHEPFGIPMSGSSLNGRGPVQPHSLNQPGPYDSGLPVLTHSTSIAGFPPGNMTAVQSEMIPNGFPDRLDSSLPNAFGAERFAEGFRPPAGSHFGSYVDPVRQAFDRKRFEEDLKQFPRPSELDSQKPENIGSYGIPGGKSSSGDGLSFPPIEINSKRPFDPNDEHLRRMADSGYSEHQRPDPELGSRFVDSRQLARSPRGEFSGLQTNRFSSAYGLGGPAIGEGFGSQRSDLVPGHLRRGGDFMPGYLRSRDSFEPIGFRNHPPGSESLFSRDTFPIGDRMNEHRILDSGFFQSEQSLDSLRKRKEGCTGWCLICNVYCETDEGRNLHYETMEHRKRAMEVVISIKQNNFNKRKLFSEDRDEPNYRKAGILGRPF